MTTKAQLRQQVDRIWAASFHTDLADTLAAHLRHQDAVGRLIGDLPVGRAEVRTSLFAEMAAGDGIVLDASPDGCAASLAARFKRVRCLPVDTGHSMLIRPDGCIAWPATRQKPEGLADALKRWFTPTPLRPGSSQ